MHANKTISFSFYRSYHMKEMNEIRILLPQEDIDETIQTTITRFKSEFPNQKILDNLSYQSGCLKKIPVSVMVILKDFDYWTDEQKLDVFNTLNNPTLIVTRLAKIRIWNGHDLKYLRLKMQELTAKAKRLQAYHSLAKNIDDTIETISQTIVNMNELHSSILSDTFWKMVMSSSFRVIASKEIMDII